MPSLDTHSEWNLVSHPMIHFFVIHIATVHHMSRVRIYYELKHDFTIIHISCRGNNHVGISCAGIRYHNPSM
ncbi:hypothetical protein AOA61_25950 [Pseudomonas sp. 2995-1]|nr:hypothetical protein AOA61_25950 [Pseudomonas sp. 2995-1]